MLHFNARKNNQGFTLIETLIILMISGILAALVTPSFQAMNNRGKITNAFNQTRGALQEVQMQAIRRSKPCTVALITGNSPKLISSCFVSADSMITASAIANGGATSISVNALPIAIPQGINVRFSGGTVATLTSDAAAGATSLSVSPLSVPPTLGKLESGEFVGVRTLQDNVTIATDIGQPIPPSTPPNTSIIFDYKGQVTTTDNPNLNTGTNFNTGTIVLSSSTRSAMQKCLVVSTPLGLMQAGNYNYTGSTTPTPADITSINCAVPLRK